MTRRTATLDVEGRQPHGQIRVTGREAAAALETLIPIEVIDLPENRQRHGFLTNEHGGIIDDVMVANLGDCLLVAVNAANKAGAVEYLRERLEPGYSIDMLSDRALLALQGPAAARVMQEQAPCLHDSDIDATTTPVEAGLTWALPKGAPTGGERKGFGTAPDLRVHRSRGLVSAYSRQNRASPDRNLAIQPRIDRIPHVPRLSEISSRGSNASAWCAGVARRNTGAYLESQRAGRLVV